jgi:hypothetical protein
MTTAKTRFFLAGTLLLSSICWGQQFEISFSPAASKEAITGRAYVYIAKSGNMEPRLRVGFEEQAMELVGVDVSELAPGATAVLDSRTLGYPFKSLGELPEGDYYVQALIAPYKEFHRSDGHTIWAHMDHWEGQRPNNSPGSIYSKPVRVHLNGAKRYKIRIVTDEVVPPVETPPDTRYVKRIKIQSKLLTQFWGTPIYLGAVVVLPKGYNQRPNTAYPVIYFQDHFSLKPPFDFSEQPAPDKQYGFGQDLYETWSGENFPRVLMVRFLHPTPFFDDSYAVNSANNGPYGDAIMKELIPYIEDHFRIIRQPWARTLVGGSTGGWETLALQVFHTDFFGGAWAFWPDPVDFQRDQLVDIYSDENAFYAPTEGFIPHERPLMRSVEGQVLLTMKQMSQFEQVLGTHGRSDEQLEAWEAVYGPVGPDGYPKPLWNKLTGEIDHGVANYMRDHSYDLTDYIETNWSKIGPSLVGKLHIYCGDMDNYYLNLAVYKLQDFLESTQNPAYGGSFIYGRPMKGHGWFPMPTAALIREMAEHMKKNAPNGEDPALWNY